MVLPKAHIVITYKFYLRMLHITIPVSHQDSFYENEHSYTFTINNVFIYIKAGGKTDSYAR